MEAGHLLLRWWGRGPDDGQSCTAHGLPGSVSLPRSPGSPFSQAFCIWYTLYQVFSQAFSMWYTLYHFSFEPSAGGTLCTSSQSQQAEPALGDTTTNLGSSTVIFSSPPLLQPSLHCHRNILSC